jgi:hypothetical protein
MTKTSTLYATALLFSTLLATNVAGAQERDQGARLGAASDALAPATHDVEITIGTGYAQGFGKVASGGAKLTDSAQAGGGVELGVGYRVTSHLMLGVYGSGSMFSRADQVDSSTNLYSASAGIQAAWHFLPAYQTFDPWVSIGTGWRGFWINSNAGTSSLQGMDLGRLQVGVDYRLNDAISISPVASATLTSFFTQSQAGESGFSNISSPTVSTFLFAGLQGRFDIATSSEPRTQVAAR